MNVKIFKEKNYYIVKKRNYQKIGRLIFVFHTKLICIKHKTVQIIKKILNPSPIRKKASTCLDYIHCNVNPLFKVLDEIGIDNYLLTKKSWELFLYKINQSKQMETNVICP